jgi:hypothetical protein
MQMKVLRRSANGQFPNYPNENWRFLDFWAAFRELSNGVFGLGDGLAVLAPVFGDAFAALELKLVTMGDGDVAGAWEKRERDKMRMQRAASAGELFSSRSKAQNRAAISGENSSP